jgi:hypothetical protein
MNYRYVGPDAAIIGLPHEVTEEEAEQLGVSELLQAAIENGSYEPVISDPSATPPSALTALDEPPLRSARTKGKHKE